MSPRLVTALKVLANLAAVTFFLLSYHHGIGFGPDRIDLDVYRIGGRAWLRGDSLYGGLPPTPAGPRLPFTYPPVAAVLLAPLALVPAVVAGTVLTLATVALVAAVLRLFLRRCATGGAALPVSAAWLLPAALLLEPVRNTLNFGQVNVILMALVAFDALSGGAFGPRGALTGLAAAVKLTPAAFVLFFLLRRDYRAAATAGMSFAAVTGLGFLADGRDSVRYWTSTVFRAGRVGHPYYAGNQSLLGVLARCGLTPGPEWTAWLVLSLAVLVVAGFGMRRALAAGEPGLALGLNALAALLISPISWSHHWVWCAPLILTLASLARRRRSVLAWVAAGVSLAVFAAGPQWWFPHLDGRELRWAPWEQVAGSAYVLLAMVLVVLAAWDRPLFVLRPEGRLVDGAERINRLPRIVDPAIRGFDIKVGHVVGRIRALGQLADLEVAGLRGIVSQVLRYRERDDLIARQAQHPSALEDHVPQRGGLVGGRRTTPSVVGELPHNGIPLGNAPVHAHPVGPLRVIVVDQQRTFADALAARLGRENDLVVVGMVPPPAPDTSAIVTGGADIVLLDGDLPDDASPRLSERLSRLSEAPRVIMLSDSAEPQRIVRAIRAGAAAWVRKNETIEQLLLVMRAVAGGEMWLPPAEMSHVVRLLLREQDEQRDDDCLFAALTPREHEVLRHLTEGLGREDLAEQLHVSRNTVRTHLQNLMSKLGVHSTLEAVVMARSRLDARSPAPPI